MLNQYKQKRLLCSNLQVSKLIRKDMNMFRRSKKSQDENSSADNIITREQQDKMHAAAAIAASAKQSYKQHKSTSAFKKESKVKVKTSLPTEFAKKNPLLDSESSEEVNHNLDNLMSLPLHGDSNIEL